jgi:hypothetical protein
VVLLRQSKTKIIELFQDKGVDNAIDDSEQIQDVCFNSDGFGSFGGESSIFIDASTTQGGRDKGS